MCGGAMVDKEAGMCYECNMPRAIMPRARCVSCRAWATRPPVPLLSWNADEEPCPVDAACTEDAPRIFVQLTCGDKICVPCFLGVVKSAVDERRLVWDAELGCHYIKCYVHGCGAGGRADRNTLRLAGDAMFDRWRMLELDRAVSLVHAKPCPSPGCGAMLSGLPSVEEQRVVRCTTCNVEFCQVRAGRRGAGRVGAQPAC